LFLIYINDIDNADDVTGSVLEKFADDTKWAMVIESDDDRRSCAVEQATEIEKPSLDCTPPMCAHILNTVCRLGHIGLLETRKFWRQYRGGQLVW
jgi:hypothetical protein